VNDTDARQGQLGDTDDTVTGSDVDHVRTLAVCVRETARLAENLRDVYGLDPTPGSLQAGVLALGEELGGDTKVLIGQACVVPWYQLLSAQDHMHALAYTLAEPDTGLWSSVTLVRAVLEASVRAWWAYDPAQTVETHVSRMVNLSLAALEDLFPDPDAADHVNPVTTALAARLRLPVRPPKGGRRMTLVGRGPPKTSDLMDDFFGAGQGAAVWASLSRTAHALPHGLTEGLFTVSQEGPGSRLVKGEEAHRRAAVLATYPLRTFNLAMERQHHFWGWPSEAWDEWTGHVQQVVDAARAALDPATD
jgi:hypothetical protein